VFQQSQELDEAMARDKRREFSFSFFFSSHEAGVPVLVAGGGGGVWLRESV
jgi:hypothetical protein